VTVAVRALIGQAFRVISAAFDLTEPSRPMTMNALALAADSTVTLRVLDGGGRAARARAQRAMQRGIVGGCPDHWWTPTALRTAACTCDR
jgi:hypothetical protein